MKCKILIFFFLIFSISSFSFANGGRPGYQEGTPDSVTVGATTTVVLTAAQVEDLEEIILVNDSDETIYVAYGASAVMNKGIRLNANGGSVSWAYPRIPQVAINAICASGSKVLTLQTGE